MRSLTLITLEHLNQFKKIGLRLKIYMVKNPQKPHASDSINQPKNFSDSLVAR